MIHVHSAQTQQYIHQYEFQSTNLGMISQLVKFNHCWTTKLSIGT